MEIEEAFDQIAMRLQAASGRGVDPSIRVSGAEWVCAIDERDDKFVIIVKEKELLLVHMRSDMPEPEINRVAMGAYTQEDIKDKVLQRIADAYGRLPSA